MRRHDEACPFCQMIFQDAVYTRLYHQDKICTIVDCDSCGEGHPLIVLNHHGTANYTELLHMEKVREEMFPGTRWRGYTITIPRDVHWHEHII